MLGYISTVVNDVTDVQFLCVVGDYDGIYTNAEATLALSYYPTPKTNFHMAWIEFGNFRKWSDNLNPFSFVGDQDVDTKMRPTQVFRRVIQAMANVIDNNRVAMNAQTENVNTHLSLHLETLLLESGYRGNANLAELIQLEINTASNDYGIPK